MVLTASISVAAQPPQQVREKEVELETRFIDASREQLLGNYDKAIPIYEEILKADAGNHAAAFALGRIYDSKEDLEKALRYAQMAVTLDPQNTWYQQFLADIFQKSGRNKDAAAVFEGLVKKNPTQEDYYYQWAFYLVRANDIDRAIRVYDQLEARIGITEELIRRKQALYMGVGDTKRAARELQRLTEAYPNSTEFQHQLAEFYEQIGDMDQATAVYQRILNLDPNDVKARLAVTGTSQIASSEIDYLNSLRPVFSKADAPIDLKIQRILPIVRRVADTGNRQLGEAALALTTLLEQVHPNEAKAFAVSGDLLYHMGRRPEAIQKYRRTLELDDTVFLVWEQLLYAYLEEGDYQSLRPTAENALDLFPNKAVVYYLLGLADNELGRPREALDALQQAVLMAGNDSQLILNAQILLGGVYEGLDQVGEADQAFGAALALNDKSPEALVAYSYALAQRGEDLERARTMAQTANDLAPGQPRIEDTCGWVWYKMKNFAQAKEWIGRALQHGGDQDPRILEHYGDVLFQLQDTQEALRYWNKALEKGSRSKLLEKKITDKHLYE